MSQSLQNKYPLTTGCGSSEHQIKCLTTSPPSNSLTNLVNNYEYTFHINTDFKMSGHKTVMMSPMDFYSSITPDCSIHPGAGSGIYEEISEERLPKTRLDKSPATNSVLNAIGECGLITYNDYCFLLSILATPVKYIDTAFNLFDVTGDEKIEAKVFIQIV